MKSLIAEIKKKKELSGLSDEFVKSVLESYLKKNKIKTAEDKKSQKIIIKEVRAELRNYAGRFQTSQKIHKRPELLEKRDYDKILRSHSSTKERLNFYPTLKSEIENLRPKSILDLGCGLNPIALASPKVKYYACDIKQDELDLINQFFKTKKIKGEAFYSNLREQKKFPKADLCLIFKVLDIIESDTHKIAEEIISNLNCKHLIVSFSTKKLSGKRMNFPKRIWFENLLKRKKLNYKTLESDNEIFYIINL